MTIRTIVIALLAASACAEDPTLGQQQQAVTDPVPGASYSGPDPSTFAGCKLVHDDGSSETAPATFVVRRTDYRNNIYCVAPYNLVPCGGYQVPFPAPWIKPDANSSCVDPNHCFVDKGPYKYQHALLAGIQGIVSHEFDILLLTWDGKKYNTGTNTYFYNGTTQGNQIDEMTAITSDPQWQNYPDVNQHVRKCTYVLGIDPNNSNALVYTGFRSLVGQRHDVIAGP